MFWFSKKAQEEVAESEVPQHRTAVKKPSPVVRATPSNPPADHGPEPLGESSPEEKRPFPFNEPSAEELLRFANSHMADFEDLEPLPEFNPEEIPSYHAY